MSKSETINLENKFTQLTQRAKVRIEALSRMTAAFDVDRGA